MAAGTQDPGDQVADVVRAALAVPGVAAVRVEPDEDEGGQALLRLELAPGADEREVALAVDSRLRAHAASGAGRGERDRPQVFSGTLPVAGPSAGEPAEGASQVAGEEPTAPAVEPATPKQPSPAASSQGRPAVPAPPRPGGRRPVPSIESPSVAATRSPQWLGGTAAERERLVLERVQQVTEGMTTTCTVVLAQHESRHTGVADGAATPTATHRSLATATARAVESAASGRLRLDVEAADVLTVAGEPTAVVVLSVLTRRGPERLSGASMAGADAGRAVVKAVLAACNRRIAMEMAER